MSKMDHKESSRGIEENKIDSHELIQKAENIVQFLMEKHGVSSERYQKARIELDDLKSKHQEALESGGTITRLELRLLQKEYEDVSDNANWLDKVNMHLGTDFGGMDGEIIDEFNSDIGKVYLVNRDNSLYNDVYIEKDGEKIKISEYLERPSVKEIKRDTLIYKFFNGDENNLTQEDALNLLSISHNERKESGKEEISDKLGQIARIAGATSRNAKIFFEENDIVRTNQFQNDLIDVILGKGKVYNNEYIAGYTNKNNKGNHLIKITDFEETLKNGDINKIESNALSNYLIYLEENGGLDLNTLQNKLGEDSLIMLSQIWFSKSSDESGEKNSGLIAKQKIEKIDGMKDFMNIMSSLTDIESFIKNIGNLSNNPELLLLAGKIFEKNTENIKNEFKNNFISKLDKSYNEKQKNEIWNNFYLEVTDEKGNIKGLVDIYKVIDKFNKKYQMGLSIDEETSKILDIKSSESKLRITILKQQKKEAGKNGDYSSIERINDEIDKEYNRLISIEEERETNKVVGNKTIDKLIKGETTLEIEKERLLKENEEYRKKIEKIRNLKEEYENYKENKKEIENKKSEDKKVPVKEDNETNNNSLTYTNGNEIYSYNAGNIITTSGENISLNPEEIKQIDGNQDMMKNIVNFYENLDVLGLSDLWEYRNHIFKAISNIQGIGFDTKSGDYLNENEVKLFLNAILKSTDKKEIEMSRSMHEFNNLFLIENDKTFLNDKNDATKKGDSTISEIFIEKYALGTIFDYTALEENLRK